MAQVITQETGKPLGEGLLTEILVVLEPYGVIGIIAPWNYAVSALKSTGRL